METNDRVERFKAEAAELNLKAGNPSRDNLFLIGGLVAMIVGVVGAFVTYSSSLGMESSIDVQSAVIAGLGFLSLTVLGAALFLRYALGKFLRLFLLRQLYEGQAHLDTVVEAIKTR